jgi:rhodanese-related sulfurtransferase
MTMQGAKSRFRIAVTEALMITAAAIILGFVYTAVMGKGLFGSSPATGKEAVSLPSVTYEEARDLYLKGEALFVDARHTYDFGAGRIKGAISVPLQDFDTIRPMLSIIPKDRALVIYCDGADCNSSRELALKLKADGYTSIKVFFGGWTEWTAHGQPREP